MAFNINDKNSFPRRQVHLDYHTSPDMKNVGENFSKENFQTALKKGKVSSITVFAKCHHGLCYYPTKLGTMHPNLKFDLLGEMIEAAHEIGVRAPVYITAGFSEHDAKEHPEWLARKKDGSISTCNCDITADENFPKPDVSWYDLCLNDGSYCKHIYDTIDEICERYKNLDGLFFDICTRNNPCYCDECKKGMLELGLNPEDEADAKKYYEIKHADFFRKCKEHLNKYHKNATIFFNGCVRIGYYQYSYPYMSHFEMEDLPTAWGGYNKMPPKAKYIEKENKYYLGMTGKFHLDWGEFGGFKTKEALKYEICEMATYGAGASIGDQLIPDGEMDMQTYENIGYAYEYLEKIEPYCYGGNFKTNLGVYFTEDIEALLGISNILLENQLDFRFVWKDDYSGLDTVIFPEGVVVSDKSLEKLKAYIADGGKVLFMGNSLIKDGNFQIDCGLKYEGNSVYDCDYLLWKSGVREDMPKTPFLTYIPAFVIKNIDAQVCAEVIYPYFNRTYGHFCSHKNTPYNKNGERVPALTKKNNVMYMAHKASIIYRNFGNLFIKRYVIAALEILGYKPLLDIKLGSEGRATLREQADLKRYCINMTYASPVKRGKAEIIDEITPIYNIPIKLYTDKKIKSVYKGINNEKIDFTVNDGVCFFELDKLECHSTVVLEY